MGTRRNILIALGAGALVPRVSFAQQPGKVWRIGFLQYRRMVFDDTDIVYGPFRQGLRDLGYVEGRNLAIEWRAAEGRIERLPELAAELVRLKVDVLATLGTPASQAAQKATTAIPIVMISVGDPVEAGLVKTLARPGRNSTASSLMHAELGSKLLEMLREVKPGLTRIAVLVNPFNDFGIALVKNVRAAAERLGVRVQVVEAGTPQAIPDGFAAMARQNADALIVAQDPFLSEHRNRILELTAKQRLPSISTASGYAQAGGLMNYGQNPRENPRRAATYIDKIFKGANPGDLPVEQPTQFELVVNRKSAKALGVQIPQSILMQATSVID